MSKSTWFVTIWIAAAAGFLLMFGNMMAVDDVGFLQICIQAALALILLSFWLIWMIEDQRQNRRPPILITKRLCVHEAAHAVVGRSIPGYGVINTVFVGNPPKNQDNQFINNLGGVIFDYPQTSLELNYFHYLIVLLAGLVAERIFCGQTSAGPAKDLWYARDYARKMTTNGMSGHPILPFSFDGDMSLVDDAYLTKANTEVDRLIGRAMAEAEFIIHTHKNDVWTLAKALKIQNALTGQEVDELLEPANPPK